MGEDQQVLVTGGSGFLGGWCVAELLRRGHPVRTTVRDLSREAEVRSRVMNLRGGTAEADADDRLSFVAANLHDDSGWEQVVDGCEHVLHVASPFPLVQPKDPDELIVPARDGTLRVLRAALKAGASRVVVTSFGRRRRRQRRGIGENAGRVGLDRPRRPERHCLCPLEDDRRARGLGSGRGAG